MLFHRAPPPPPRNKVSLISPPHIFSLLLLFCYPSDLSLSSTSKGQLAFSLSVVSYANVVRVHCPYCLKNKVATLRVFGKRKTTTTLSVKKPITFETGTVIAQSIK
jgi:hypothetical protein